MRWWDSITRSMDMNFSNLWEIVKDRKSWCAAVHGVTKSQTQLSEQPSIPKYVCVCVCVCVFLPTNKKCRQCFPGFTNEEMSLREVVTYLRKGRGVIQVWLTLNLCSFCYRKVPFSFLFLLVGQHLNRIPKYGSCFFIMSLCRGVSSSH